MLLNALITACNFRISGGTEFLWNCYGPRARFLDFDGAYKGGSEVVGCVFNPETLRVYEVTICPPENEYSYRWIDPEFKPAYQKEAARRGQEFPVDGDIQWVELELQEDALEKAKATIETGSCTPVVLVPLNVDKDELFLLMTLAHQQNITLNQLVEKTLVEAIAHAEQVVRETPKATKKSKKYTKSNPKSKKKGKSKLL